MKFTKQNLYNIKCIFEEKTGTDLNPAHRMRSRRSVRKMVVLAAAILCCLAMAAFTYPQFSSLDGDELALSATYGGNGIVSIYVENRSDKTLRFQEQTRLMRWVTSEEAPRLGGKVTFEHTEFEPHSSGTMIVDLSKAYDVEVLEQAKTNDEWYYLLLTNNNFLFGQDWMCSISFGETEDAVEAAEETLPHVPASAESLEGIGEELRFYFADAYHDEVVGLNGQNFAYLQKVDEIIKRFEGNVVPPVFPMIMVTGPSTFLDPHPSIDREPEGVIFDDAVSAGEQKYLVNSDWMPIDGYHRLVGATTSEKALTLSANLPLTTYSDGSMTIPLIYTFVYDAASVQNQEDYAFIYGQFLTFGELESYKVCEDEHYAFYEVTDLFYTDLDAYIDYFLTTREDIYFDEQIRERVHNIYNYYKDKENLSKAIYYPANE